MSEVDLDQGMFDRVSGVICFEVSIGHVGLMTGPVWQYVIPGSVPGRSGTRNRFVPFVGSLELWISAYDDAAVVE